MRKLITVALCLLLLPGCALTPTERKVVVTVAAIVVAGAFIAHRDHGSEPSDRKQTPSTPNCMQPGLCN